MNNRAKFNLEDKFDNESVLIDCEIMIKRIKTK